MNTNNTTAGQTAQVYGTNYSVAVNWLNNQFIMCNDIVRIDEELFENLRFSDYDEETGEYTEIYQFFLTNCSLSEVEFLEENFGLRFAYSPLLGLYILCVTHWGTSWDYVYCETTLENAARELGQDK